MKQLSPVSPTHINSPSLVTTFLFFFSMTWLSGQNTTHFSHRAFTRGLAMGLICKLVSCNQNVNEIGYGLAIGNPIRKLSDIV